MLRFWAGFGTLYLVFMTVQDYRNKRKVDDRRNATMFGLTLSLLTITTSSMFYKIAVSLVIAGFYIALKRLNVFGEADLNGITWILFGYGLLGVLNMVLFFIIFSVFTVTFMAFKRIVFKYKEPVAFFGIILLSYMATNILIGAYGGV